MNKKTTNLIIVIFLLITVFYMITCSNNVIESVTFSISIWKDNLFPTLFPFFIVSNLLLKYGFVELIGKILTLPMQKLFKLPGEAGFVLAASLFSGFPSGAKYTKDLVSENKLTKEEGARLLTFTHYSNPLFILGMVGTILLNNKTLSFLILISHIFGGLLTGYIINHKYNYIKTNNKSKINKITEPTKTFGELLTKSIFDSLNTMFLLLGVVTIFLIINSFINKIITLPPILNTILSGTLEMTQGVKLASTLNIPEIIKIILITAFISFGGLSVHMQTISIIAEENIKYKTFLSARILHTILASFINIILFHIFII